MAIRPKWEEEYWYVGEREDGIWDILKKANANDWYDKFHMASNNCFATREDAEEVLFDVLEQLTGEDGYQIWMRKGNHS